MTTSMFTVKLGGSKNSILSKTARTVSNFLKNNLNKNTNVISNNSSIEMIAASSTQQN